MEKLCIYLLAGSGPGEAAGLVACKAKWADGWLWIILAFVQTLFYLTLQSLILFLIDLDWMFWK